jgi:hypothetical protein
VVVVVVGVLLVYGDKGGEEGRRVRVWVCRRGEVEGAKGDGFKVAAFGLQPNHTPLSYHSSLQRRTCKKAMKAARRNLLRHSWKVPTSTDPLVTFCVGKMTVGRRRGVGVGVVLCC